MTEEEKREVREWAEALSDHFTEALSNLYTQLGLDDLMPTEESIQKLSTIKKEFKDEN
jgi:hypothetical protein